MIALILLFVLASAGLFLLAYLVSTIVPSITRHWPQ